jgi:restriction system protein
MRKLVALDDVWKSRCKTNEEKIMARPRKYKTWTAAGFGTQKQEIRSSVSANKRAESLRRARAQERRRKAEARRQEADARKQAAEAKRTASAAAMASKEAKKKLAAKETAAAEDAVRRIQQILAHTLSVDDVVDWGSLIKGLEKPLKKPVAPAMIEICPPPDSSDRKYTPKVGILGLFSAKTRERAVEQAKGLFQRDTSEWKQTKQEIEARNARMNRAYKGWVAALQAEIDSRQQRIEELQSIEQTYASKHPRAINQYCEIVLANSQYPADFPQQYELDYQPDSNLLVVDYLMPGVDVIPTIKQIRYVAASDVFKESLLSQSAINKLYDDLAFQIALRTTHELYEADTVDALASIIFNGYVQTFDKATGHDTAACILSFQADREKFLTANLERVEAKSCFDNLDGKCKGKPSGLSPVTPVMSTGRAGAFVLDGGGGVKTSTKKAEGF